MDFEVDQILYLSDTTRGSSRLRNVLVSVTKVGRKWVSLSNGTRFDRDTLQLDGKGYSSPGSVYLTEQAFLDEQALSKSWWAFVEAVRYKGAPPGLTLAKLQEAAQVLGIKLEEPSP